METSPTRPEPVRFHFDPRCPWCYQTSRWVLHLERLGVIELSWGVYCLELGAFTKPVDRFDPDRAMAGPALRTAVLVREEWGQRACGAFYAAIGHRYFVGLEDLRDPATIEGALADAGLDPGLRARAVADPATWETALAEHLAVANDVDAFGVPTIRLDGGDGPGIFGPVVAEPPSTDDEAVELWQHVSWLVRKPGFFELKRSRPVGPDLPYWHRFVAERAAAAAATVQGASA
jgi:protein-disulfide isomerase-like protein with CxxC motif